MGLRARKDFLQCQKHKPYGKTMITFITYKMRIFIQQIPLTSLIYNRMEEDSCNI